MKKISLYLLLVLLLLAGIGYFLPNEVHVERQVQIKAPIATVYQQVRDLKSWDRWSGLVPLDTALNLQYLPNNNQVDTGFCWKTTGLNTQKRRLLITASSWCDSLSTCMSFDKEDMARSCFHFNEQDGTTVVRWEFRTKLGNDLLSRWRGPFIHKLIAPDLKLGLTKLKAISEEISSDNSPKMSELQKRQPEPGNN